MADQPAMPNNKIAFVLDGRVQEVLFVDDRLAAILLSSPTIVDVKAEYEGKGESFNLLGWEYDGTNFSATIDAHEFWHIDPNIPPIVTPDTSVPTTNNA